MANLFLFDIDGTLVGLDETHLDAYQHAYREVLGKEVPREIIHATFGMVEKEQHKQIFDKMGFTQDEETINQLIQVYYNKFNDKLKSLDVQPLPGVRDFLEELERREQYKGILTAHIEPNGRAILRGAGLENRFGVFGFFREGLETRADIARDVVQGAKKEGYNFDKTIVIGDSCSDVRAGKAIKAVTIAVATSYTPKEKLIAQGADIVLNSLREYPFVFEYLAKLH